MAKPLVKIDSGVPQMSDHQPSTDVTAGDVLVIGNVPYVAIHDIAANELGAIAAKGAVFLFDNVDSISVVAGTLVYWDDPAQKLVTDPGNNACFGVVTVDAAFDDVTIAALHDPEAEVIGGALLLESGDYLLKEDGFNILV